MMKDVDKSSKVSLLIFFGQVWMLAIYLFLIDVFREGKLNRSRNVRDYQATFESADL